MITLLGHGYIGREIASRMEAKDIPFNWNTHDWTKGWVPDGPIINAAGYTGFPNVDACEVNRAECLSGNVLWPLQVEERSKGYPVVHISSGCVYNGYKDGGWLETDEPNFTGSFYSRCKVLAQSMLRLENSYILRVRMPFGKEEHQKNYLTKLRRYEKLIDVRNSLSCIEDVAEAAIHFALNQPTPGIYNCVNTGEVTTRKVADFLGLQKDWFTMEEFRASIKAPRSNCVLNTDKMQAVYKMRDVHEALSCAL